MVAEMLGYATTPRPSTPGEVLVERRVFPRFKVELVGSCSIAGSADVTCTAIDLSLAGLALRCGAAALIGDQVTASLPQVAFLRGTVVRTFPGGFAIALAAGRSQRERLASYLVWLVAREENADIEDRVHVRLVPLRRIVTVTAGGVATTARIVDLSQSGVALTATRSVAVGDELLVGDTSAVVVRTFQGGFAARFAEALDAAFDVTVTL